MVALFFGASIPMLDERSAARRPAYAEYAARTAALIPLAASPGPLSGHVSA